MLTEVSAGCVVYNTETKKILLILDLGDKWALPKGLIEEGESNEEAALREVKEETGVGAKIVCGLDTLKYFYTRKEGTVSKTLYLFLAETTEKDTVPQWEVKDAQWFGINEVAGLVGYDNLKPVIEQALNIIEKNAL